MKVTYARDAKHTIEVQKRIKRVCLLVKWVNKLGTIHMHQLFVTRAYTSNLNHEQAPDLVFYEQTLSSLLTHPLRLVTRSSEPSSFFSLPATFFLFLSMALSTCAPLMPLNLLSSSCFFCSLFLR